MSNPVNKAIVLGCAVSLTTLITMYCVQKPEVKTEPEADVKTEILPAPDITMKPYHHSMSEEMQISFEIADEIIVGVYTGSIVDKQNGLTYYFDHFKRFNKKNLTWGSVENVLLSVLSREVQPEIITQEEFKSLSELDKVGICWDYIEQTRYVYLVEGEPSLVFLKQIIDEENNSSYRYIVDVYPVTNDCNAKAVFDLMVTEYVKD